MQMKKIMENRGNETTFNELFAKIHQPDKTAFL